ncbi:prepilin-type N-terminal cleavage/methylation domain-containing protein [Methylobacterium marchantiae]|uniref:Prepilin-type N-terminal cleavage/methylation domain-containing protein n=1 Tax=Methylobacterium marchantiae TaxID=600331 RepID=A0ABW3X458_9HYPH|nr:hypothetical protein AIGOOFII_4099 [Methylobacterium marchantiae]
MACLPPLPLLRRGGSETRRAGFTLIETIAALLLVSLLAGLSLPFLRGGPGPAALRAGAYQVSALLRGDRNAAFSSGRASATLVDPRAGIVRSERGGAGFSAGPGMRLDLRASLPDAIRFYPDGRSSGGDVTLSAAGRRIDLRVSRDTGAIVLVH